jgi:hypothetical protein
VVANDAYQVNYYSGGVGTLRVINTGQVGSPIDTGTNHGKVCADIYVFDSNQEMLACCSCPITANGLLTVSPAALLGNPLTGVQLLANPAATGVIKIVSDNQPGYGCDARSIINPVESGLRAWETHFQGTNVLTETAFAKAPLTNTEQAFLGQACSFVLYLGSGKGTCLCLNAG